MFKNLLKAVGLGSPGGAAPPPPTQPSPADAIYNMLFCDDLSAFAPKGGAAPADWQALLFGPGQDAAAVEALANDETAESRVRALAFHWLRAQGREVPKGLVLGVVIEVPLDQGLDVLAGYADGGVRYINHTGRMTIIEPGGLPEANQAGQRLVEISRPVVAQLGPWDKPRMPPPSLPNVRLNFIVSDGLYFGQGPFDFMQQDGRAGPLLQQASHLLTIIVDKAAKGA